MTEAEARAALAAFDGPGGLERWIAARPWLAAPGGWVVPEPFHGHTFGAAGTIAPLVDLWVDIRGLPAHMRLALKPRGT